MVVAAQVLILGWIIQVHADPSELWPPPEPKFLTVKDNVTVREGELAKLPCSILHLGTKQVAWKRTDQDYMTSIGTMTWVKDKSIMIEHIEKSEEVSYWNMLIKNVKPKHSGTYECQVTTPEKLRRYVHLHVYGPPIREPDISVSGREFVETGEDIRLICNATGGPQMPEDVDWFKDGDKIESKKYRNIIITKYHSLEDRSLVSELIIDRSTVRDSGTYICRSTADEIDSIKVTVLFGDSPRLEREPQKLDDLIGTPNKMGSSIACSVRHSMITMLVVLVLSYAYHLEST